MYKVKRLVLVLLILLVAWIVIDLNYPFKTAINRINAEETAILDGAMWRSYYEKKPVKLFFQSATLMRNQFHFPFWQSNRTAFYAAKAAFVFKDGKTRTDYEKALPYLKKYYLFINDISQPGFNADSAAASELEWWIIRRNREEHPPAEWANYLAKTASIMYHLPVEKFRDYANLRVEAMLLRDGKGTAITESDWQQIHGVLLKAWESFAEAIKPGGETAGFILR